MDWIEFKPPANPDAPIMALTECGSEMSLLVAHTLYVGYDRADSEALARALEQAAALVRQQA